MEPPPTDRPPTRTRSRHPPLEWHWPPWPPLPPAPEDGVGRDGAVQVGVDEAGRGCLAGPVYAAAVAWRRPESDLDPDLLRLVRDSKTLTPSQRERARAFVEREADAWGVGVATVEEIDRFNILGATMRAMHRAVDEVVVKLNSAHLELLVDGTHFVSYASVLDGGFVPHTCITEGDGRVVAIAAASILAKTHRDDHMKRDMHEMHPQYGWDTNAGYGTAAHMSLLELHGACDLHRRSFAPVRKRLERPHTSVLTLP
jgi:ribonuclease HII